MYVYFISGISAYKTNRYTNKQTDGQADKRRTHANYIQSKILKYSNILLHGVSIEMQVK